MLYDGIIGTGGIGSGKFFVLNGDHTLGREESRSGHFLGISDYCKQHIILHYIRVLLGPSFSVIPVGKVGTDDTGLALIKEMDETGFDMRLVGREPEASTLFSFCFYYPDGSGGNLTTDNSASSAVEPEYIEKAVPHMERLGRRGIIMAAPEVPMASRIRMIELGHRYGMLCTASFTTGEAGALMDSNIIDRISLIALNLDEAASIAGITCEKERAEDVVKESVQKLSRHNPAIMVSVTAGKNGSWCWDGDELNWFPSVKANVVSTAGAGDAFFSGLISGIALGLTLFEAQQLASLIAGLSVCSPDTINKDIERHSLWQYQLASGQHFSEEVLKLISQ